jgi:hypothetical protein
MGNLRVSPKQYVFVLKGQKDLKTSAWLCHQTKSLLERNLRPDRAGSHFVLTR